VKNLIVLEDLETEDNKPLNNIKLLKKRFQSNIRKIYLYQFFMGFYLISGVLVPFFLTWGHLNILEFDLLQSYYFVMTILLEIPCGAIGDRLNRKKLLILAGLSSCLAALIYGLFPTLFMFYVGETLFALGDAFFSGSIEGIIHASLKIQGKEKNFSKVLGKSNSIFLLGIVISSPIGSFIGYAFSLQLVMLLMCIPYICCSIIALTLIKSPYKFKKKSSNFLDPIKSSFKNFKKNKRIRFLLVDMVIIEMFILILSLNYQFYLYNELKIPMIYFGFINAGIILSELLFTYLISTNNFQKKNRKLLLLIISILPGIFYIMIGLIHFVALSIILILLIIGLGLSRYILFYEVINKQIKDGTRTTSFSIINMIRMVPGALMLPLFGLLIISNINIAFIMIGIFIISFTIVTKVKKEYF